MSINIKLDIPHFDPVVQRHGAPCLHKAKCFAVQQIVGRVASYTQTAARIADVCVCGGFVANENSIYINVRWDVRKRVFSSHAESFPLCHQSPSSPSSSSFGLDVVVMEMVMVVVVGAHPD